MKLSLRNICGACVIISVSILGSTASAQQGTTQPPVCEKAAAIDSAYFRADTDALAAMHAGIDPETSFWNGYLAAFANYRLALLAGKDKSSATEHTDTAIDILMDLDGNDQAQKSEANALLSAVYGLKIATHFLNAIRLGPRSTAAIENALSMAPKGPRALLLDGVRLLNTPDSFGGDKAMAEKRLQAALKQLDHNTSPPCWGRTDAHYWLVRLYKDLGDDHQPDADRHIQAFKRLQPNSPLLSSIVDLDEAQY